MTFDTKTYKRKNRLLWIGAILLLLVCWYLSFAKTYEAYRDNKRLGRFSPGTLGQRDANYQVMKKYRVIDSLAQSYALDSTALEAGFLQEVSMSMEGIPVSLSYDGSKSINSTAEGVRYKEIGLQGKYQDVVKAVSALEKVYFISTIKYEKENWTVRFAFL